MPGKIFVNYRRGTDAAPELKLGAAQALNVAQYLENRFGKSRVFIDIDRLRAGQKFPVVLESKLSECAVMLAVIGPGWLDARDQETGARRLDNPEDWVRLEIERALARDIPVIPVLVGGVALPLKRDLPSSLQPLLDHQIASISHSGFPVEMAGLARDVDALMGRRPWGVIASAGLALLAGFYVMAHQLGVPVPWPWTVQTTSGPLPVVAEDRGTQKARVEREAKAKADEAERQRLAAQADEERKRVEAEAVAKRKADEVERQRQAALKADEDKARAAAAAAEVERKRAEEAARRVPQPGQTFRDCTDVCPEMVVVPASTAGSKVSIPQPIAVGKFEVTFAEWDACVAGGGCKHKPVDRGWGRGKQPVIDVSWDDATNEYLPWLSKKTGKTYRLLTEAEWEYAARAGTTTKYFWGDDIGKGNANCVGCGSQWDNKQTAPVGSFKSNAFGLYDMHGNVWEWCEDKYDASTSSRVLRGGSWNDFPDVLRSAFRYSFLPGVRISFIGFRLARTL